jgi:hypothetical protein
MRGCGAVTGLWKETDYATSCCMLSSGWFTVVWILNANFSKHPVCSIFIGGLVRTGCSETLAFIIQMAGNHPHESKPHSEHGESFKSRISYILFFISFFLYKDKSHHHHNISIMELGHLLACSGLTCPEVSSKVCLGSFCQSGDPTQGVQNFKTH